LFHFAFVVIKRSDALSANFLVNNCFAIIFFFVREWRELRELWPHAAALDGFAVYKKAALQLSIRVIRVIRGQPLKRRKPFSICGSVLTIRGFAPVWNSYPGHPWGWARNTS
jgi:hypothetical protein